MERFTKHHDNHKRHLHRQHDAYELYELEHTPHVLIKAPSTTGAAPQPHHVLKSEDYSETGIGVQPRWLGASGVDYYPRSTPRGYEGDCGGDVDCMANKFIEMEHEKFEQSKWISVKK
ncbi:hypothetical protein SASPL_118930 [Salvia splendens]|uniref:Uncharacterized protein n=1 Tax=Salvia splendens TaxID=180675 RepID=A0A8X8Y1C1_SALSN|nr:hypothetical protein SASPL_118930 [Salvia splendens]